MDELDSGIGMAKCTGQMTKLHRYVLRSNRVTIKEELELSVLDHLIQSGVFTLAHSDDIEAERTRRDKAGKLLNLLEIRGSSAFSAFVSGLESTQKHLAKMIRDWVKAAENEDPEEINEFFNDVDSACSTDSRRAVLQKNAELVVNEEKAQSPAPLGRPVYDMGKAGNGGVLFIVNNAYFAPETNLNPRTKSDVDVAKLYRVFTEFGFQVDSEQDLLSSEMETSVFIAARKAAKSNASCFACAILTHGDEGILYGTDGGPVRIDHMVKRVCRIPGLVGKPKLFFLQAERGFGIDKGVATHAEDKARDNLPCTADVLVCSSSAAGNISLRSPVTGGLFVNAIEDAFTKHGKEEDVLSLMTRVSDVVSMQAFCLRDPFVAACVKQMPVFESSLRKTLYLCQRSRIE